MQGFIKLHRQITEWEWYSNINVCRLFIHCLLKANHKDNKWQGIVIERGSFITSIENLAFETGLSGQQIRTALNKLKSTGEITSKTTNRYSVISIKNWDMFQVDNKQDNKQITNKQQTDNKQITTNNNDKNEENEKESKYVIEYLNQQTNYNYKFVDKNIKLVSNRLKEYSKDELLAMIDYKCSEWLQDERFKKYLRPATLFNASKCADYIAQLQINGLKNNLRSKIRGNV